MSRDATLLAEPDPIAADSALDAAAVQRRTLRLLFVTQVLGGVGMSVGMSVGALLAADMASIGVSGLAQSAAVVGGALLAVPATRVVRRRGRRWSLAGAYAIAALGGAVIAAAATYRVVPLLFAGLFLFGGGTTAGLQARYAAVDLAPPASQGRHLSLIIWATTLGAVAGPTLAPVAGAMLAPYGLPTLAAPFVVSVVLFAAAGAVLLAWLRPDPMLVALRVGARASAAPAAAGSGREAGVRAALRVVLALPPARLGVAATAVGHLVMVGVMAMAPVHIRGAGHGAEGTLRIVGIVLSLHVAGMYALSPVMGLLADRVGRRPVIVLGVALLLAACAVVGTAGHDTARLALGLVVLGLGWSGTMVAGSTLLSTTVPAELRPSAQGLSDLVMGLAGASAGAISGWVVQAWGYPTLAACAALATLPVAVLALGTRTSSHAGRAL